MSQEKVAEVKVNMSDRDFRILSEFIYDEVGIKLPIAKKLMLEARIRKRLKDLSIKSYSEYCKYVFSPSGVKNELINLIDVVTTNKTDFFREPAHFTYLVHTVLPPIINSRGIYKNFNINEFQYFNWGIVFFDYYRNDIYCV